ncbi:MAG: hypothetical protein QW500_04515 [Candidatus Micrarchaeia archaeon]
MREKELIMMDMFKPKPMPRVQDAKPQAEEKIYTKIIGDDDDDGGAAVAAAEDVQKLPQKPSSGVVKIELAKVFFKCGQEVSGRVSVKMNKPLNAESLVVAVWGQKAVNVPPSLRNQGETGARQIFVSQRSRELSGPKVFDGEHVFEFKLPIVAPMPDIAANYRWYVGASLLAPQEEITDMIEIKVADY